KKCLGKMGRVAKDGLTVLFVSHNMSAISGLCQRVIVLEAGQIVFDGPTRAGIERYMGALSASPGGGDLRNAPQSAPAGTRGSNPSPFSMRPACPVTRSAWASP